MSLPSAHSAARVHRRPRESGDPGQAILYQLVAEILPLPILALNQLQFPRSPPFLDLAFHEGSHLPWSHEIRQRLTGAGRSPEQVRRWHLIDVAKHGKQGRWSADVERAIASACKYADARAPWVMSRSAALGPRFCGGDGEYPPLNSREITGQASPRRSFRRSSRSGS